MNGAPRFSVSSPQFWGAGGAILLFLLAGCGDDDAPVDRSTQMGSGGGYQPRRVAQAPTQPAPLVNDAPPDPMAKSDPLDNVNTTPPADPLAGDDTGLGRDAKPFADPMADTPDGLSQMHGPQMPTEHSHWLRGSVFNAAVDVRVNSLLIGTFRAPVDKDITMKCRAGVNTVTFTYTPILSSTASAKLDVLESEHTPPIAPLATFRSPRSPTVAPKLGKPYTLAPPAEPVTQTFIFVAK